MGHPETAARHAQRVTTTTWPTIDYSIIFVHYPQCSSEPSQCRTLLLLVDLVRLGKCGATNVKCIFCGT
jgi:hypothetical protein